MLKMRSADPANPSDESVEAVRRRAQYRLVGTVVLVVVGVIGFPLVFDTQPRPVNEDLPIIIPDKTQVAPLQVSPEAAAAPASSSATTPAASGAGEQPALVKSEPAKTDAAKADVAKAEPVETVVAKPELIKPEPAQPVTAKPASVKPAPVAPTSTKPEPDKGAPVAAPPKTINESARAQAILEGKAVEKPAPASAARVVVQVGSYGDQASVTRVRRTLEAAGLKTYTQVVSTSKGKLTRVRVGPFASVAEAEKVTAQIKKLGLDSSVVKL